jgi:hypothetical protein
MRSSKARSGLLPMSEISYPTGMDIATSRTFGRTCVRRPKVALRWTPFCLHPPLVPERVFRNGRYKETRQRGVLDTAIPKSLDYFITEERRAQIVGKVAKLSDLEPHGPKRRRLVDDDSYMSTQTHSHRYFTNVQQRGRNGPHH